MENDIVDMSLKNASKNLFLIPYNISLDPKRIPEGVAARISIYLLPTHFSMPCAPVLPILAPSWPLSGSQVEAELSGHIFGPLSSAKSYKWV